MSDLEPGQRPSDVGPSGSHELPRRRMLGALGALGAAGVMLGSGALPASAAERAGDARAMAGSQAVRRGRARHITIMQTSDVHGQFWPHDEFFWENGGPAYRTAGSLARIKTIVEQARRENERGTLLVDTGDCLQGSGYVQLSEGAVVPPIMKAMGYDIVAPGNWDVDFGKQHLIDLAKDYGATVVSSNMFNDNNGQLGSYLFTPAYVKVVNGVRCGFIGYDDPDVPTRQLPSYSVGIKFVRPDYNAAQWIKWLREDQRCDVVFAMTHMGIGRQYKMASADYMAGLDYILGADTHERIRTPLQGTHARLTEPGAFGSFVGRLDIVVEKGSVKEHNYELIEVSPERFKEDRKVRRVIATATKPYRANLETVVGHTKTVLQRYYVLETPLDNLITDAAHEIASEMLAEKGITLDVTVSNGFRFCQPLVPSAGGTAAITREYLYSALPNDAQLKYATVPGKLIRPWFEKELDQVFATDPDKLFGGWVTRMCGMQVRFTVSRPFGQRIDSIAIGGKPLDETRDYVFSACEREGDPENKLCRIIGVENATLLPMSAHQAIEKYLARHSPVAPKIEGRVSASDLPQLLLGQLAGTSYKFS